MNVTYVGHATLLLEFDGVRILTDPNFDPKLGRLLPRVSAPGIALAQLPELAALVLTHAHADHLSFKSLDALPRDIPLFAPPVVARWLRRLGYSHAVDLAPGESIEVEHVKLSAAAATHHGNRYGFDRWRSATNMYLFDTGSESCFFAGDTALTASTDRLVRDSISGGRRLDVALLPIGHAPWWKPGFRRGHLTHEDAVMLFERLDGRVFIPYHWGTFRHVTSGAHDAIVRLVRHLEEHHLRAAVRILQPGESLEMTPGENLPSGRRGRRAIDRALADEETNHDTTSPDATGRHRPR